MIFLDFRFLPEKVFSIYMRLSHQISTCLFISLYLLITSFVAALGS